MRHDESRIRPSRKEQYWIRNFKLDLARECSRHSGFPPINGIQAPPKILVSITDYPKVSWSGAFVHFFKDDYKFDGESGVWRNTDTYAETLKKRHMGSLTPDYSTFCDSGDEICRWNLYRSRLVGYHLEKLGIPVIPTLIWWSEESLGMALSGLAPERVYAVSTMQVWRKPTRRAAFCRCMKAICARLRPKALVVYGTSSGIDWLDTPVIDFPNGTYNWTRRQSA